jgi:hypothetical protein
MKRILVAVGVALMLLATVVAASDVESDLLGWYFDVDGTYSAGEATPGVPVDVFLVLSSPTVGEIVGWEASYAIETISGTAYELGSEVLHGGINALDGWSFSVTYDTPLPCVGPTVLASITLLGMTAQEQHCITLHSVENPTIPGELPVLYLPEGGSMQVQISTFEDSNSSAWFGALYACVPDPCPNPCIGVVESGAVSWSSLKGLFD